MRPTEKPVRSAGLEIIGTDSAQPLRPSSGPSHPKHFLVVKIVELGEH